MAARAKSPNLCTQRPKHQHGAAEQMEKKNGVGIPPTSMCFPKFVAGSTGSIFFFGIPEPHTWHRVVPNITLARHLVFNTAPVTVFIGLPEILQETPMLHVFKYVTSMVSGEDFPNKTNPMTYVSNEKLYLLHDLV